MAYDFVLIQKESEYICYLILVEQECDEINSDNKNYRRGGHVKEVNTHSRICMMCVVNI